MKNTKSAEQRYTLEAFFAAGAAPVARGAPAARDQDGRLVGVSPQQIKVWFRNAWQRKRQDHSPFKV